jgi:hypothetical protein
MGAASLGVEGGFGFEGVVAALHAVKAVAKPRVAPIPAKGASELAFGAGAGLVGTGHAGSSTTILPPSN